MTAEEQTISLFETRVRELILAYEHQKEVQKQLERKVQEQQQQMQKLQEELQTVKGDYDTLKTARLLNVADNDVDDLRKKIAKMIRTIDKCVAALGGDL